MSENTTDNVDNHDISVPKSVLLTEASSLSEAEETLMIENQTQSINSKLIDRTVDAVHETLSEKLENISIHEEEEDPSYVTPVADPYGRAIKYMEHHNVMQIFQKLTAEIIYHRPDDPLTHMLGELKKMKKEQDSDPPPTTPE